MSTTLDETDGALVEGKLRGAGKHGHDVDAARMLESLHAKLFDDCNQVTVGRFEVRRRVGAGGMGVVMEAFDPQLQRLVAVKLLHDDGDPEEQARLLDEARAMASVRHPNLVTVYEAGMHRDAVFIAMEFVEGGTLRTWLDRESRGWRAVVAVFLGAARGLAAIHGAGLVHRDFKPDNVLLGTDGRAQVTDFGLARSSSGGLPEALESTADIDPVVTQSRGVAGTPAYIAPEQWKGARANAASDQWSFCVALHEAIYGVRPFAGHNVAELSMAVLGGARVRPERPAVRVPRWLARAIDRGLSEDPGARFESMHALVGVLERGLDRRRGRTAATVLALTGAAALTAVPLVMFDRDDACMGVDQRMRRVWTAERRAEVEARFAASSGAETWKLLGPRVDARVDAWGEGRRDACQAHARGEQSDQVLDLRMRCFDRRANELESWIERGVGIDGMDRLRALRIFEALPPVAVCNDIEFLLSSQPVPEAPELRARVSAMRRRTEALAAALVMGTIAHDDTSIDALVTEAKAIGYEPLIAETMMLAAKQASLRNQGERAAETYQHAFEHALATKYLEVQVWSAVVLVFVHGEQLRDYPSAMEWGRRAEALLRGRGAVPAAARALANNRGVACHRAGRLDEARAFYEDALRLNEEDGLGATVHAIGVEANLGILARREHDYAGAAKRLESARERAKGLLGPRHAMVGNLGNSLASAYLDLGRLPDAEAMYRASIEVLEASAGPNAQSLAHPLNNLGQTRLEAGDVDGALKLFDRSIQIWEATSASSPALFDPLLGRAEVRLHRGDTVLAREDIERARQLLSDDAGDESLAYLTLLEALLLAPEDPQRSQMLTQKAAVLAANSRWLRQRIASWDHGR